MFSSLRVDIAAYVGESMADPLRYYSNITTNTVNLLRMMSARDVYSSTCATYRSVEMLPITVYKAIYPYGKSKLHA